MESTRTRSQPLSIAVVGDDYTAGVQNRVVWPTLMAQRTGWSVANFALPDAGFVADGQGGHAFTYQVDRAQAADPRIIVIVGGIADAGLADAGPISVGAIDAINKIKLGGQQALVVGPTWYETPVPESVVRVSDAVRKVAEEAGVPYLDALDPPWLTRDQMRPDLSGTERRGAIRDRRQDRGVAPHRGRRMTRMRWFDIAAIALAIAVIAGFRNGFRLLQRKGRPTSNVGFARRAKSVASDERPTALFIGDSYTAGAGLGDVLRLHGGYADGLAVRSGGEVGTGYISGGPANRSSYEYLGATTSFGERIPTSQPSTIPTSWFSTAGEMTNSRPARTFSRR